MAGAFDMTLDDIIQSSGSKGKGGKKGGKGRRDESSDGGWRREGGKSKGKGRGYGESGGSKDTKLDMSLDDVIWSDGDSGGRKGKGKGKSDSWGDFAGKGWNGKGSKGRGKNDWGGKGSKGSPSWMEHDDWRGDENGSRPVYARPSGMKSDWDDWSARDSGRNSTRWASNSYGDDFDASDSRGGRSFAGARPRAGRSPSWRRIEQPSSNGRAIDRNGSMRSAVGDRLGGQKRSRGEDNDKYRNVKRIKVTNVPRDLAARDIKEAFEAEAGKTTSCELDRGTAYLSFARPADARKAVETFDRGELNGKTIHVTLEY